MQVGADEISAQNDTNSFDEPFELDFHLMFVLSGSASRRPGRRPRNRVDVARCARTRGATIAPRLRDVDTPPGGCKPGHAMDAALAGGQGKLRVNPFVPGVQRRRRWF